MPIQGNGQSFLLDLIRNNGMRLWWDARSGSFFNWGVINPLSQTLAGEPGGALLWTPNNQYWDFRNDGFIRVPAGSDFQLRITEGTLYVQGQFGRGLGAGLISSLVSKGATGGNPDYRLTLGPPGAANAVQLQCGAFTRTWAHDYRGAKSLAVTFEGLQTPLLYRDGVLVGPASGALGAIPTSTSPFYFGNDDDPPPTPLPAQWPLYSCAVCREILDAVGVADLDAAMKAQTFPNDWYKGRTAQRGLLRLDWGQANTPVAVGPGVGLPLFLFQGQAEQVDTNELDVARVKAYEGYDFAGSPCRLAYGANLTESPQAFAYGEWGWIYDRRYSLPGTTFSHVLFTQGFPVGDWWELQLDYNGSWRLQKVILGVPTVILSGTLAVVNKPVKFLVSRDALGNWTVTINDVVQGSALDNQLTFGFLGWMELPERSQVIRSDRSNNKCWFRRT
jgi:hypothetical protein